MRPFRTDDEGATAIEYALIAAVIMVAIVVGLTVVGQTLDTTFSSIAASVGG